MSVTKLAASFAVMIGMVLTLAPISTARAQEPDVQITELDCNGDPELVLIKNLGDAAQPLGDWQLQSDPPDSEVFDLTMLGGLVPGPAVSIQSGPSAGGAFIWGGLEFVFRDDDPTDYARIVDDTGVIVHQVNCAGAATPEPSPTPSPEPSPTPSPEPSPTPSPEPSPAADVPNGGGPPPLAGDALSDAAMIYLGGSMAAAGVVTVALSWLGLRLRPVLGTAANLAPRDAKAARRHAQPRGSDSLRGQPISEGLGLALVGLLATGVVILLLRYG
jgi:hypothetical protein